MGADALRSKRERKFEVMNLSVAIIIGSAIVAVSLFFGIYYGLMAVSDSLYTLCHVLCSLRINVNHHTKSEQEGGTK